MLKIAQLLGKLTLGQLANPAEAGSAQEGLVLLRMSIMRVIFAVASGFDQVFRTLKLAWQGAMKDVNNISTIIRDIAKWDQQNWQHLTGTVLPNSLKHLDGAIHKWADAKFLPRTFLRSKAWKTVVSESHTAYVFWKTNHLWLHGFRHKGWPDLLRWKLRYATPQLKQLWLLNPHAYPLEPVILDRAAAYLHSPKGQTDLRNLTRLIVDESPQVWRHVETATLAILNMQYP